MRAALPRPLLFALACWLAGGSYLSGQEPPARHAASFRGALFAEIDAARAAMLVRMGERVEPGALSLWQAGARATLAASVGPLPGSEHAPAVELVERLERPTFTLEKLLIESRPAHHVTGLLFLPDPDRFEPPWPGVALACGHAAEGKAYPIYMQGAANLAHQGIAALIFDPLDQGERAQELDADGSAPRWGTRAHNVTGLKAALLGWSQTGLEAWDGMSVLSVLAARPDVDGSRLGVLGNSGGGTQSAQLLALDARVRAAAPSCYLTSLPQYLALTTPPDMEQAPFGFLGAGFDHDIYLSVRAPVPALVCARSADFFPIDGTRAIVAAAGAVFGRLGSSEALSMLEDVGEHGWNPTLVEGSVAWMVRWLRGEERATPFEELPVPTLEEARVTPGGQVLELSGERSIHAVLSAEARRLASARQGRPLAERVSAARAIARVPLLVELELPGVNAGAREVRGELLFEHLRLAWEDGTELPAARVSRVGGRAGGEVRMRLSTGGVAAGLEALTGDALAADESLLLFDAACLGDAAPSSEDRFYGVFSVDANDAVLCHLLGRPLVGRQATQILGARLALAAGRQVQLLAEGRAVLPALHAAAFEPQLFSALELEGGLRSFESLFERTDLEAEFGALVHGALGVYELDDLAQVAGALWR